jgi:hypothetical protein
MMKSLQNQTFLGQAKFLPLHRYAKNFSQPGSCHCIAFRKPYRGFP